jgi:hypothetical protein
MSVMAECLVALNRGAEAVPIIDECCRLAAGKDVDPQIIPTVMDLRLRHFEKAKDAAGCRQSAEMWEHLNRPDVASLYAAARYRAVTAAVTSQASGADGPRRAGEEADRAMAWLRQAVAAGFRDVSRILEDEELTAVRRRADYAELLWNLADTPVARPH